MADEKIVAAALLTRHDLNVLGQGFTGYFPVPGDVAFENLIREINRADTVADFGGAEGLSTPEEPS